MCARQRRKTDAARDQYDFYNFKTTADLIILKNIIILYDIIGGMYKILEHFNEQFRFIQLPTIYKFTFWRNNI